MTTIIYKGIEIKEVNGYYKFDFNGTTYINKNLRFAKVIINRNLKMRLKKGDIVKIQNPLPDENPNHRYIVVQDRIEQYNENDQIEVELISDNFAIHPIVRIEMRDLVKA